MTTKEAQSEAPSVDMREMLLDLAALGTFNDDTTNYKLIDEVEAKINRLITEAELRGFDKAFDSHDYDGLREYRKALSNNLSKGKS